MSQPNFNAGVSPQIVETMLGEVLDSMISIGEIKADCIGDFAPKSDVIFELTTMIGDHLNKRCANPAKSKNK